MNKFCVGDRVTVKIKNFHHWGKVGTIRRLTKDSLNPYLVRWDDDKSKYDYCDDDLKLIGGSMNKYDELESRIEALQDGWTKEADDILNEVDKNKAIRIATTNNCGCINIFNSAPVGSSLKFPADTALVKFHYSYQCEKLGAFRQALLWLLNHSAIKKDLVGQEVKAEIEGKVYKVRVLHED